MWQQHIPIIEQHQNFVLTSHANPDCDALGSELALAEHLRKLDKNVAIINSDGVPSAFRFLDPKNRIKRYSPKRHTAIINKAEVIIVLDASGGWSRVGPVGQALAKASATKLCIDHHPDAVDFVDYAVIDTEASATAELIYELVQEMGGSISKWMAQALYAAIMTDTGSFRFPKTSTRTHTITANLLTAGANPLFIYRQIYEQYPVNRIRLKGTVMQSIQLTAHGQIAYYGLTQATLKEFDVKNAELDGFASLGQQIGGVRIAIFCTEATKGRIKISLRSDGSVAINQIAQAYGGGGHTSAAGGLVEGTLNEIMAQVVEEATLLLQNNGSE